MKNLVFINSSTKVPVVPDDSVGNTTLAAATYYAELGVDTGKLPWHALASMHWIWNAALVATITIEATSLSNVKVTDAAASGWVPVATIATVSPAASASQDLASWVNVGYGRLRAKVVVATPGVLRGSFHTKEG